MEDERIIVRPAIPSDVIFADQIIYEMESSAVARGSGISKRSAASIIEKIIAIISLPAIRLQAQTSTGSAGIYLTEQDYKSNKLTYTLIECS